MNLAGLGQVTAVGFFCVSGNKVFKSVWSWLNSDDSCKTTRIQTRFFVAFPDISEKPKPVSGKRFEHKVSRVKM